MGVWMRSACGFAVAFTVTACGGPATPPTPPPAAPAAPTAATPPASPIMDPKGTIDATKSVASAATAATGARQAAAGMPPAQGTQPGQAISPGAVAAAAGPALTPTAPKYEPGGRRDPFESLEIKVGSDRATVAAARLTGVIRSGASALALVETSDGIGYILKTGDTLADGRLVEISANSVVFAIAPKPGQTTNRVVLRLPSD
jgi:hypothetical protein